MIILLSCPVHPICMLFLMGFPVLLLSNLRFPDLDNVYGFLFVLPGYIHMLSELFLLLPAVFRSVAAAFFQSVFLHLPLCFSPLLHSIIYSTVFQGNLNQILRIIFSIEYILHYAFSIYHRAVLMGILHWECANFLSIRFLLEA